MDATIIAAPSSTKNEDCSRDPDMHQTRKDNQWYFGMKAKIGADSKAEIVHSVTATVVNVNPSWSWLDRSNLAREDLRCR